MKLLSIIILLPISVFSQTDIAQLHNDSDVVNFVRKVGPQYLPDYPENPLSEVSFNIYGEGYIQREKLSNVDRRFADSVTARKWFVADFDGDQLQDLAFYGRTRWETGIFIFLGGTSRRMIRLADRFYSNFPRSIEPFKIGNTNSIIIGTTQWTESIGSKPFAERFVHDTLIYKSGGFVEYNRYVKQGPVFDSIDFRIVGGMRFSDPWYLRLYKDGSITYVHTFDSTGRQKSRRFITEKKTATIDAQEMQDLLDYIGFTELPDDISFRFATDLASSRTTVYFPGGRTKKIEDYGSIGSHGLRTLYAKMDFYIENCQWRLIARGNGFLFGNSIL